MNEYPSLVVRKTIEEERRRQQQISTDNNTNTPSTDEDTSEDNEEAVYINLPFAGPNGESLMKKLKEDVEKKSANLKIQVTYTPTKLGFLESKTGQN